jgi:LDH2 family malate/lactate/ureidoglycolate dehydrogenase
MPLGGFDAGHKGYALSLMVELMSGALSGGGAGGPDRKVNCNNFTIIAIDPARVGRDDAIVDEATRFAGWIKSAAPTDPARPVLLPGEQERSTAARHLRDGLPLDPGVIATLRDTAIKVDLPAGMVDDLLNASIPT